MTKLRYYKSHVHHSLLNYKPCQVTYYRLSSNRYGSGYYCSFTISLSRKYGQESNSLDCLSHLKQTYHRIREFRKYNHAKPCSAEEFKKNFYKLKRKLIKKAKELRP